MPKAKRHCLISSWISMATSKALLALSILSCLHVAYSGVRNRRVTSIISFGDSYADTGNLAMWADPVLPGLSTRNLPYGEAFFGRPTGRASDGRLVLDFIADALGLPLVPPSLAKGQSFATGVNFAVVGAPALNLTYLRGENVTVRYSINSSLDDQLMWFQKLKPSLCHGTPGAGYGGCFGSSLFVMGEFGANDHISFLTSNKTLEQASAYVPKIVDAISNGVERLIRHGAKYVVVADMFPVGCLPVLLTLFPSPNKADYDRHGCLRNANRLLAQHHNTLLRERVEVLRNKYPYATIIAADYYRPFIAFLKKPDHFGLNSSTTLVACCGGGGRYGVHLRIGCGQPGATVCADPSAALQWDGVHLTESAYRNIAQGWLHGPHADPPILHVLPGRQNGM